MLRVLLCFMLFATWPGQAVRGAATASPAEPASPRNQAPQAVGYIDVGTLYVGGSPATVNASSYFLDPDKDRLTYSVNSPSPRIATVSIVGSTVTIRPVAAGNTSKIIVTATDPGGLTATQDFNVTVQAAPPPPPPNRAPVAVGSISNVTLQEGGSSATRVVSGKFSDPDKDKLTYSVNSPSPSIVTVSISGSTITIAPAGAGTTGKIIVTATDPGGLTATQDFTATVEKPPPPPDPVVATVTVGPASVSIEEGQTQQFSATAYESDNTEITGKTFTWTSSHATVATINNAGLATAHNAGITAITAKVDGKSNAVKLTVTARPPPPPVVDRVAVSPRSPSIKEGQTRRFSATAYDADNKKITGKNFTWTSSNTSVATVSPSSGTTATATGVDAGYTTIKASVDGKADSTTLTVTERPPPPPVVDRVAVSPRSPSVKEGQARRFSATAYDADNKKITGKNFTWTSSNTSVATVSPSSGTTATATGVDAGYTTIKASVDGKADSTTLTVTERPPPPPPVTCPALVGSIANQTLTVGVDTARIDLTPYFSFPANFVPVYLASSTDASVATTSMAGDTLTVTPRAAGTDTVSVTVSKQDCDPVKQSFAVAVSLPCPAAITDAPIPDQTLVAGAGMKRIDLTRHFEYVVKEGIKITVTSPSPEIAVLSIEGSALKINPKSGGQIATVTVTVADTVRTGTCTPVSLSFMVTVEESGVYPYHWMVSGENVYRLTGNVGIGVEDPDRKLVVDGKIRAEEVYVPMTPADYVFEADYDLMPLEYVARHIRDHGHLPGVASGAEMKANGIGVSRMQTLLLEKIEELALHVIDQHEQLRAQGGRIASQQQKLEMRRQQASELEQRLRRLEL